MIINYCQARLSLVRTMALVLTKGVRFTIMFIRKYTAIYSLTIRLYTDLGLPSWGSQAVFDLSLSFQI